MGCDPGGGAEGGAGDAIDWTKAKGVLKEVAAGEEALCLTGCSSV